MIEFVVSASGSLLNYQNFELFVESPISLLCLMGSDYLGICLFVFGYFCYIWFCFCWCRALNTLFVLIVVVDKWSVSIQCT